MTADQIATQTCFRRDEAEQIAERLSGYEHLTPAFLAMMAAGYRSYEICGGLTVLRQALNAKTALPG